MSRQLDFEVMIFRFVPTFGGWTHAKGRFLDESFPTHTNIIFNSSECIPDSLLKKEYIEFAKSNGGGY